MKGYRKDPLWLGRGPHDLEGRRSVSEKETELLGISEERVFGSLLVFSDKVWFICCIADIDPECIVY